MTTVVSESPSGKSRVMLKASPEKYVQLGLFRPVGKGVLKFTSPALADGRLYLRLQDGSVACHDLTEAGNK